MKITDYDIDIVARTVLGEADNTLKGKQAVVAVIRNRARIAEAFCKRTGKARHPLYGDGTLAGAAQANPGATYKQFSAWNKSDLLRNRIDKILYNDQRLVDLRKIVQETLQENIDPTFNATHYFAEYIKAPSWADEKRFTVQIGVHRFYDLEGEFEKGKLDLLLKQLSELLKKLQWKI